MTREQLVSAVLQNALTVTGYKTGCDGRGKDRLCDCIGLIIGAFDILGVRWPGTHGTNWTARYYVRGLSPVKSTIELQLGDVVFKAREPGQDGYALPDTYKDSTDRLDYYHIGTVTSVNPFKITHCTTVPGGIQTDKGLKNWKYKAVLQAIEEGGEPMDKALVIADQGSTVNLRAQPSKAAKVLAQVPVGSEVDVYDEGDEWSQVAYKGTKGYMMTMYTVPIASDEPPVEEPPEEGEPYDPGEGYVNVKLPADLAIALWEALDSVIGHG